MSGAYVNLAIRVNCIRQYLYSARTYLQLARQNFSSVICRSRVGLDDITSV